MARILGSLSTVETAALSEGERILKLQTPFMKGQDVATVQLKVGADIDGIFGPKTQARVKQFQENNGLEATGVVGPSTWALINKVGTVDDPARSNQASTMLAKTDFANAVKSTWNNLSTTEKVAYGGGSAVLLLGIAATIAMNN